MRIRTGRGTPRSPSTQTTRVGPPSSGSSGGGGDGGQRLRRRYEAQRGARHQERVVALFDEEQDLGRHAGAELQVGILDRHHGIVGHDVLDRLRRVAHLLHVAAKALGRIRIDAELDGHPGRQATDVGLGDVRVHLRLAQTLARARATSVSNSRGSIRAMTWPFVTGALKSACSSWMRPETWLPTWTSTSGDSVPVALTRAAIGPRVAGAVSQRVATPSRCRDGPQTARPPASRVTAATIPVMLRLVMLLLPSEGTPWVACERACDPFGAASPRFGCPPRCGTRPSLPPGGAPVTRSRRSGVEPCEPDNSPERTHRTHPEEPTGSKEHR